MRTREWQVTYGEGAKRHLSSMSSASRSEVVIRLSMLAQVGEVGFLNSLVATKPGRPDVHALDLGGRYALVVRHVRGLSVQAVLDGKSFGAFCREIAVAERAVADCFPVLQALSTGSSVSPYQLQ